MDKWDVTLGIDDIFMCQPLITTEHVGAVLNVTPWKLLSSILWVFLEVEQVERGRHFSAMTFMNHRVPCYHGRYQVSRKSRGQETRPLSPLWTCSTGTKRPWRQVSVRSMILKASGLLLIVFCVKMRFVAAVLSSNCFWMLACMLYWQTKLSQRDTMRNASTQIPSDWTKHVCMYISEKDEDEIGMKFVSLPSSFDCGTHWNQSHQWMDRAPTDPHFHLKSSNDRREYENVIVWDEIQSNFCKS